MCGIIAANIKHHCGDHLITGLQHLAYRGYDSAGMAIINDEQRLHSLKRAGKIDTLSLAFQKQPLQGSLGIAHTRWATHGKPDLKNAHPHVSSEQIAIVHNGIIENYTLLRQQLQDKGYTFLSDTDSEAIAHLLHLHSLQHDNFISAIQSCCKELEGSYALAIINAAQPDTLWGIRQGSPLLAGLTPGGHYLASDTQALAPLAKEAMHLEDGDIIEISPTAFQIFDKNKQSIQRPIITLNHHNNPASKGPYKHYMQKEIAEQPLALARAITQNENITLAKDEPLEVVSKEKLFSQQDLLCLTKIKRLHIVACGTSYHAGLVAQQWLQQITHLPVQVTIASEQRYQKPTR